MQSPRPIVVRSPDPLPAQTDTPTTPRRVFAVLPYLYTRLVPALYHVLPLPAEFAEPRLRALARAQVAANALESWLVLSVERVFHYDAAGQERLWEGALPHPCALTTGRLQPAISGNAPEMRRRQEEAEKLCRSHGSLAVLAEAKHGGHDAGAEEIERLAGLQTDRVPLGLACCPSCGEYRGECLDPNPLRPWLVVPVHCRCQNVNRCAACGEPLHERRLNGNYYVEDAHAVWHVPGFVALAHRCPAARTQPR